MIDRYTYYVLQFLEGVTPNSKATVGELVSTGSFKLKWSIEVFFINIIRFFFPYVEPCILLTGNVCLACMF